MAPPFTYRTLVGTYKSPDGSPGAGTVRFVPSATVMDAVGHVIVPPLPLQVTLDGSGGFSIALLCTDVAGTTPTGWTWHLDELFVGGRSVDFQLLSGGPSTVDISTLIPVVPAPVTYQAASQVAIDSLDVRVTAAEATATAAASSAAASAASAAATASAVTASAAAAAASAATAASLASDLQVLQLMGAI